MICRVLLPGLRHKGESSSYLLVVDKLVIKLLVVDKLGKLVMENVMASTEGSPVCRYIFYSALVGDNVFIYWNNNILQGVERASMRGGPEKCALA